MNSKEFIPLVSCSELFNVRLPLTSEFVLFEPETTLMLLFVLMMLSDCCLSSAGLFVLFELCLLEFAGWSWIGLFPPEFPIAAFEGGDANVSKSKLEVLMIKDKDTVILN